MLFLSKLSKLACINNSTDDFFGINDSLQIALTKR